MDKLNLSHAGFKAYDIRGIVPDDKRRTCLQSRTCLCRPVLSKNPCASAMTCARAQKICEAASRGLTDGGADVYNIGRCGTEMMYFGTFFYKMDGGFMITASHNPSQL